jgi:hypothetical protein
MKKTEEVSVNEVIWRLLQGHHGIEVMEQNKVLLENSPNLLSSPDFDNWEENMIRRGALSLCAGAGCPLTNLILRVGPKSAWDEELKFGRYAIEPIDFYNFKEINYEKILPDAMKKYKDNPKVLQVSNSIKDYKFDFDKLQGIILYKIKSDYIIIDGVHRAMGLMMAIVNFNIVLPKTSVIILENEITVKRKLFFFKKLYKI